MLAGAVLARAMTLAVTVTRTMTLMKATMTASCCLPAQRTTPIEACFHLGEIGKRIVAPYVTLGCF